MNSITITPADLERIGADYAEHKFDRLDELKLAPLVKIVGIGSEPDGFGGPAITGYGGAAWLMVLDELVRDRDASLRPTTLSTSLTKAEYLSRYGIHGERIEDRLRGSDGFETDSEKWAPGDRLTPGSLRQPHRESGDLQ